MTPKTNKTFMIKYSTPARRVNGTPSQRGRTGASRYGIDIVLLPRAKSRTRKWAAIRDGVTLALGASQYALREFYAGEADVVIERVAA
jgi:hypothetical protein